MKEGKDIVFFDGECGFCDTSVRQLMLVDRGKRMRFAPLQGQTAEQFLDPSYRDPENLKTMVFLDAHGKLWSKSDAVIEALRRAGGIWKIAALAKILPAGFRNWFYDRVAERRRSIINKADCPLPTPEQRQRLLP